MCRIVRPFFAGMLLVVALAAAGCGGGSSPTVPATGEAAKSVPQILKDVAKAAAAASSVHISGHVTEDGKQEEFDLTMAKADGAIGTMTLDGQPADIVVTGGYAYMWAGPGFWTEFGGPHGDVVAQVVANKWLRLPTSNSHFAGLSNLTNSRKVFNEVVSHHGAVTNKGVTTYEGQSAIDLFDDSANEPSDLYIAATGTPYPIAIVGAGGEAIGTITFDAWNKKVAIAAPSGAIDLSYFTGG